MLMHYSVKETVLRFASFEPYRCSHVVFRQVKLRTSSNDESSYGTMLQCFIFLIQASMLNVTSLTIAEVYRLPYLSSPIDIDSCRLTTPV